VTGEPEDEWDWYEDELAGLDLEEQLAALLQPIPLRSYPPVMPQPKPTQAPGEELLPGAGTGEPRSRK
jgi:hypothetical protein